MKDEIDLGQILLKFSKLLMDIQPYLQKHSSSLNWTLEQGVTQECYLNDTHLETFNFTSSLKASDQQIELFRLYRPYAVEATSVNSFKSRLDKV